MHLLIAIACFLGGAVVGCAAALALVVAVVFAAVPPSGPLEYKDIPKRLAGLGLPALGAVVVAGALAAVRAPVPWPFHN
ncbi:MAG TPA: hypothetical protein VK665_10080, partial [Candidatus Elarobacter sp.]|nr:hypothetical protein [Candidatus Elarobacter sp.]